MDGDGNSHFLMALGRIDGGHAIEIADEKLRDVVSAVRRTGKKGTVTVTLTIQPNGERGFAASAKVAAKAPDLDFGESFFFSTRDNDLTREAPEQVSLALLDPERKVR